MSADLIRAWRRAAWAASAALATASAALACPTATQPAPSTAGDAEFVQALGEYEASRWPAAYERLGRLADQGHAEAARIALQMWRYNGLYGTRFDAAAARREQWSRLLQPCRSD